MGLNTLSSFWHTYCYLYNVLIIYGQEKKVAFLISAFKVSSRPSAENQKKIKKTYHQIIKTRGL
jgi:hypothetical protein